MDITRIKSIMHTLKECASVVSPLAEVKLGDNPYVGDVDFEVHFAYANQAELFEDTLATRFSVHGHHIQGVNREDRVVVITLEE